MKPIFCRGQNTMMITIRAKRDSNLQGVKKHANLQPRLPDVRCPVSHLTSRSPIDHFLPFGDPHTPTRPDSSKVILLGWVGFGLSCFPPTTRTQVSEACTTYGVGSGFRVISTFEMFFLYPRRVKWQLIDQELKYRQQRVHTKSSQNV